MTTQDLKNKSKEITETQEQIRKAIDAKYDNAETIQNILKRLKKVIDTDLSLCLRVELMAILLETGQLEILRSSIKHPKVSEVSQLYDIEDALVLIQDAIFILLK